MNKAKLKSYAPAARRDFIQAVTDRAHFFGLSETQITPVEESGDVAIIGGRPFPIKVATQRKKLEERVKREGFNQVMEAVSYTWFNRFLALRFMELHGYLEHGFRVLSSNGSSTVPEILDHASELDLPGLNKQMVVELKLDGGKDAELYRLLLVAQCNALHSAMPFLFEKIEDETELLLPDNLLHSDSLIRKLVTEIEEEDWQEVEIIGWLYQFYISEKKDQVIGKVVKSEDIPAATQLFTPNWIVKYMVQNSLGRQWLTTYPDSPLKAKMEYYIEPAEQTDEVNAQLAAITPDSLDPEILTLLDPAVGSGHILVEAYDVFKEIYLERGYSSRDFPRMILEKNLFGLDIDSRAAQMAGFALLMKARKDDRRILRSDNPVKLNVMAIQESSNISIENSHWGESAHAIRDLIDLYRHGKTFGSLIQMPDKLAPKLLAIEKTLEQALIGGDLYASQTANELIPLVEQAKVLAGKYDCVVANPPYMGSGGMNSLLKEFAKLIYQDSKSDTFAMFFERSRQFAKATANIGFVAPYVWMFISSYETIREKLINDATITTLVQLEYNAFEPACVPVCSFTLNNHHVKKYTGSYIKLSEFRGHDNQAPRTLEAISNPKCGWLFNSKPDDFKKLPGSPIAYWISNNLRSAFKKFPLLKDIASVRQGLATSDNKKFVRFWYEVNVKNIGFGCSSREEALHSQNKWFPFNKGGTFRKWYGNFELIVNWQNDGADIKASIISKYPYLNGNPDFVAKNPSYYFKDGLSWSALSSGDFSLRRQPVGFIFADKGQAMFPNEGCSWLQLLGMMNSIVTKVILGALSPTLDFNVGYIAKVPVSIDSCDENIIEELVRLHELDWNSYETSWGFQLYPLLSFTYKLSTIAESWQNWLTHCNALIAKTKVLETENNRIFIKAYGLQGELTPDVHVDQVTLSRAEREADVKRLISYSIGCMMGRYSLDQPGLVYAINCNVGFDQSKHLTFPADDDGIVPVIDMDWFPDDAASRFEEFLKVAWSPETLEENLKFVADSLSPKGSETPRETIRRYISTQFFKDHLQTYKKRPIYWFFSSGKQRAFECLVYLHRYNEATLSRMRNEYVTPLQGKFSAQVDYLANEVNAATSTVERNRLQKQLDTLRKKQIELAAFDDLLRHYADQRISLDLDDGVKVNYGKFGGLLAEVKAIMGGGE